MDKIHIILGLQWILYCFFHSFLANDYIKKWIHRFTGIGVPAYRIVYNIFALVYLFVLLRFQIGLKSTLLFHPIMASKAIALLLIIFGNTIMLLCIIKYFKQLSGIYKIKGAGILQTDGLHKWVRHPLYFGTFIFLIGLVVYYPLLKNMIATSIIILYTLAGAWLEEKKLILTFGEAYKSYQQKVPMIIPGLKWHSRKKFAED